MSPDEVLLDLLNSRLVVDGEPVDELADDRAAARWLRDRGAPHDRATIDDARAVRASLSALLRGAPGASLDGWLAVMRRRPVLSDSGLDWIDATPADRRFGAAMIEHWATLVDAQGRSRLRECEAPDCQHVLIDRSHANTRRWHSMETCGNREKARRHYARIREERESV